MIEAKKSLGQHWLKDADALDAMVCAADISAEDTVLEIGPGLGTLTMFLVSKAKKVIAVEFDEALARNLKGIYEKLPEYKDKIEIIEQDVLKFDFSTLPAGYKVAANIPYYLTSNLLRILCEAPNPFKTAALLVQKEVGERVCASPGDMSILSVSVQFYCDARLGDIVPAELFTPPPKVDSQILKLIYSGPKFDVDTTKFFRLVKAGFSEKRKKLRSSLSGGLSITKTESDTLLSKSGIDPNLRAQALSLEDWYRLYQNFGV